MAWTIMEENRIATLESLVATQMETIEELATKLMLSQTTTILEYDIQVLQGNVATLQSEVSVLQGLHGLDISQIEADIETLQTGVVQANIYIDELQAADVVLGADIVTLQAADVVIQGDVDTRALQTDLTALEDLVYSYHPTTTTSTTTTTTTTT